MTRYSLEPRTRTYVKGNEYLSFARNLYNKYWKQLLNTASKAGIDALKAASKKVVYKSAEAISEFIESKIGNQTVKQKPLLAENSINIE